MPLHISISPDSNSQSILVKPGETLKLFVAVSNRVKSAPLKIHGSWIQQERRRKHLEQVENAPEPQQGQNLISLVSKSFAWLKTSNDVPQRPKSATEVQKPPLDKSTTPQPNVPTRPPSTSSHDAPRQSTSFAEPFGALKLAYCMLQVLGTMSYDANYVKGEDLEELRKRSMYFPGANGGGGIAADSLKKLDFPVFSCPPTLIFSDISLNNDESRSFQYEMEIPNNIPESFRGRLCRIGYRIVVSVGVVDLLPEAKQPIHVVHHQVPFKVVPNYSVGGFYDVLDPVVWYEDRAKVSSLDTANSRREMVRQESLNLDIKAKFQMLVEHTKDEVEEATSPVLPPSQRRLYTIRKNGVLVCQLILSTTLCIPGQTIVVDLTFPSDEEEEWCQCLEYSATLESWEEISDKFAVGEKKELARKISTKHWGEWRGDAGRGAKVKKTRFGIDIPLNMNNIGRLASSMVSLKHHLRWKFTTEMEEGEEEFEFEIPL